MARRGDADNRRALATAAGGGSESGEGAGQRVALARGVLGRMVQQVTTRDSAPEMESHAKALPARCETEQHPDRPRPVCCRAIAFFLFARMIVETAFLITRKYKFDANVRR